MDPNWRQQLRTSDEQPRPSEDRLRAPPKDKAHDGARRPSATTRVCGKCGQPLSGQFVRALEGTFHLDCFTCQDCGETVASKFFPYPESGPGQYPLCERDYFKRLNLLCHACGNALRGSYITALDRKYHVEHFTCSMCDTVFGASDSYYEHDGMVYCHYHYSTRFAQKCNGCQTAILKQFVEIFRNGENQHWHPECYMIHKYWNVRLAQPGDIVTDEHALDANAGELGRKQVRQDEERIEQKVLWIWRTLSGYEEKSATCISDMLLHVSNGAYVDGVMAAKKFILHVELLFNAADDLDKLLTSQSNKGLSYSREAKLLCKKVVAFFTLLSQSQDTGVRRLGVTQELLSLVTGLAHYLKLLIRICLQGSLRFERDTKSEESLHLFLGKVDGLDSKLEYDELNESRDTTDYVHATADTCPICTKPVEDRCFRHSEKVFHYVCMRCESCKRDLHQDFQMANWDNRDERLLCDDCIGDASYGLHGFVPVTRLQQYVHLLRVAHARLLANLRKGGALPHTSDDPNLDKYDSSSGHRQDVGQGPPLLRADTRSKSYAGRSSNEEQQQASSYENTLSDIRRLRSTRMDKHLSNAATKRGRESTMIDGQSVQRPGSAGDANGDRNGGFHVVSDRDQGGKDVPRIAFGAQDSIRLDDIPRLVAAEQAKEQRPNASRFARDGLQQSEPKPKLVAAHRRNTSGGQELDKLGPEGNRQKKFFSELTALEYFIVRHVAVLAMEPLLEGHYNQEELLDLIGVGKATFWGKFGKAFQKKDEKPRNLRKKGVFNIPLEILVERDGEECSEGVGPNPLKIPALVQDTVAAMKTMDMSIEGVFRKNGNIKRLKQMEEAMDTKGSSEAVDLNQESPVQVAALLKRFLRSLPDPVMTYKLHRLFVTTQKIQDEQARLRILHLACCLLPKAHRDTMEVLFCFLNWAASFSVVDEESGSKMDVHNLATVIAPNILFSNAKTETMEDSFYAIEAVSTLISYNELMAEVPEDIQNILNDSFSGGSAELTTKEILKKYADIGKTGGSGAAGSGANQDTTRTRSSHGSNPVVQNVDHATAPWQAETQMRGPPPVGGNQYPTPPAPNQNGFYGGPGSQYGSRDSFGANGSPHRQPQGGRHMVM